MAAKPEQLNEDGFLCKLKTGRDIYKGDPVFRRDLKTHAIAECMYVDSDGDRYLCFEGAGNAWIDGPLNGVQTIK